jgi:methyl-accepting chemotaxis protein
MMALEQDRGLPAPHVHRTLRLALAIPILLVGTLCAVLAWQVVSLSEHNRWVAHTDEVIASTWRVAKLLVDQETGLRARLLSGDDAFLQPYEAGRADFPRAVDELRGLVADNPAQQARIDEVRSRYEAWRRIAEEGLARSRATEVVVSPALRADMRARKAEMDAMRAEIDTILAEEGRLLAERQRAARRTTRRVFLWGGAAGLVVGILGALFLHRLVLSLDESYARAFRAQAEALRTSEALAAEVTEQLRQAETALLDARRGP